LWYFIHEQKVAYIFLSKTFLSVRFPHGELESIHLEKKEAYSGSTEMTRTVLKPVERSLRPGQISRFGYMDRNDSYGFSEIPKKLINRVWLEMTVVVQPSIAKSQKPEAGSNGVCE
jgi:hypothetical protein